MVVKVMAAKIMAAVTKKCISVYSAERAAIGRSFCF
jgi:hypothetical protein